MPEGIQELRIERLGQVMFVYFAWLGGRWTDLAPFGNRLPH